MCSSDLSDPKKVGNKKAVADSEKGLDESSTEKLVAYRNKAGKGREKGSKLAYAKLTGKARVNASMPKTPYMEEEKDPCWKGYEMVGMKKKGGKPVPNCVPVKEENLDELYGKGSLPGIAAYHTKKSAESKEQMEKTRSGNKKLPVPKKVTDKVSAKDLAAKYHASQAKRAKGMMEETLDEKAPPGREDQVKALKKKFPKGSGSPFAIAWSSYKKSHSE